MEEIWKDIEGYEGRYQVSNLGQVKRLASVTTGRWGITHLKELIMKQTSDDEGYLSVGLTKDNKQTSYRVHRLVAQAFIPNLENKPEVNHKDGVKYNNLSTNLEWCTDSENMIHALEHGLFRPNRHHLASISHLGTAKTSKRVRCIETGQIFRSQLEADRQLGLRDGSVSNARLHNRPVNGMTFELL